MSNPFLFKPQTPGDTIKVSGKLVDGPKCGVHWAEDPLKDLHIEFLRFELGEAGLDNQIPCADVFDPSIKYLAMLSFFIINRNQVQKENPSRRDTSEYLIHAKRYWA